MGMNLGFLFNKELFLGDLKELNEKAQGIAEKFVNDYYQSNDNIFNSFIRVYNLENSFNEKKRTPFEYEYIIIDGIEIPCGLND